MNVCTNIIFMHNSCYNCNYCYYRCCTRYLQLSQDFAKWRRGRSAKHERQGKTRSFRKFVGWGAGQKFAIRSWRLTDCTPHFLYPIAPFCPQFPRCYRTTSTGWRMCANESIVATSIPVPLVHTHTHTHKHTHTHTHTHKHTQTHTHTHKIQLCTWPVRNCFRSADN